MRIAISTDGSSVSGHFGRCPSFTIVDIEDGNWIVFDNGAVDCNWVSLEILGQFP